MDAQTDQALLDAAKRGDRSALEQLLERHQSQIYRFGMKMCRDPQDAQDVLQETLLAAARTLSGFRGGSSITTWFYTIARSFCIKKRRHSKFVSQRPQSLDSEVSSEAAGLIDPKPAADDALASKELDAVLLSAVERLDAKYREVLVLRDMEGLTAAEVAEVLGIRVDAVKSRLHRARKMIRAELAPLLGVPGSVAAAASAPCPDVLTQFSRHLEDEIDAEVCTAMEQHLAQCTRCRNTCDSLKRTLALCRTASTANVPESVQRAVRVALSDFLDHRA